MAKDYQQVSGIVKFELMEKASTGGK